MQKRNWAVTGRKRRGATIILLLTLLLAGLPSASAAEEAPAVAPAPVVVPTPSPIGCILPLSGRYAAYGSKALDAVLLAAGVFNAAKQTPIPAQ